MQWLRSESSLVLVGSWLLTACPGASTGGTTSTDSTSGDLCPSGCDTTLAPESTSIAATTDSADGTATSGGEGGGVDGGELPPGDECRSATDCIIDDDCCHCIAYPELPETHSCANEMCEQTDCGFELGGVPPEAACIDGNCRIAKVDCDPAHTVCEEEMPQCDALELPVVIGGCWGPCISMSRCAGFLYGGAMCPDGYFELRWSACAGDACGSATACVPSIDACGTRPSCACGIDAICEAAGYSCYDDNGPACCTGDATACQAAG